MSDFEVIYADPPWRYDFSKSDSREIENHYPTMTQDELCTLDDLRYARGLYGGDLVGYAGTWRLVGAKIAGQFVTLGPVVEGWSE